MYAIVNGLKLFYHKEGSGRPVILLHGSWTAAPTARATRCPPSPTGRWPRT